MKQAIDKRCNAAIKNCWQRWYRAFSCASKDVVKSERMIPDLHLPTNEGTLSSISDVSIGFFHLRCLMLMIF
jgi:hypothetical protein